MIGLLTILFDILLQLGFFWAITAGIAISAYFFFTEQEYDIKQFDSFLAGTLPKHALIYNEDTRFGIFSLLYTFICIVTSGPLQLLGCMLLVQAWAVANLIGFIIDLPFFAYRVIKSSGKTNTANQKEQVQKHNQLVSRKPESGLYFIDLTLEILENYGFYKISMPIFTLCKKITLLSLKGSIYSLILVPRLLFSLVNMIDRYFFGKVTLNQDLYWLMIKTGNEEIIDDTKGRTTPLRKAIQDLNVRAIRALANDPNTNINELNNEITLLEVAMAAEFKSGIEVILKHPEYKLYTKTSDLVRIGKAAIAKKNKKVLVQVLKHIDNTSQLNSLIRTASFVDFNEASELILNHLNFESNTENIQDLARLYATHKKTDNLGQLVKLTEDQQLLKDILNMCIKKQFSEGIGILIDRLFIVTEQFEFLFPLLTNKNYAILQLVIKSMKKENKEILRAEFEDRMERSSLSLTESMDQIRYLESMHKIDYESLAKVTLRSSKVTLRNSLDLMNFLDKDEMEKHMQDSDCLCPITQYRVNIPLKIEAGNTWEKGFYEFDSLDTLLKKTAPRSPHTRQPITKIKLAVDEYSEALILAMLKYATENSEREMTNKIIKLAVDEYSDALILAMLEYAINKKEGELIEALELILNHLNFESNTGNIQDLARIYATHKKTDNLGQLVKLTEDQQLLKDILNMCIKKQFSEGIGILIDRLFIVTEQFEFLFPLLTNKNYAILQLVIKSMKKENKEILRAEFEDRMERSSLSLTESMDQIRYLGSMHKIDYESLAKVTLRDSQDLMGFLDKDEMEKYMQDSDCLCPITQHRVIVPIKIKAGNTWEKGFYELDSLDRILRRTNNPTSPITRQPITKIKLAVDEYSDALILAMLEYAIDKKDGVLIREIEKQDNQNDKLKDKIDEYNRRLQNESSRESINFFAESTARSMIPAAPRIS